MAETPQPPPERPDEVVVGEERFDAVRREPAVTMVAERYVLSGSRAAPLVLKEGDLFLCTNQAGHAPGSENSALGLYFRDTRHLSRLELLVRQLSSPSPSERRAALGVLVQYGVHATGAVPEIRRLLDDEDERVREAAVSALAYLCPRDPMPQRHAAR